MLLIVLTDPVCSKICQKAMCFLQQRPENESAKRDTNRAWRDNTIKSMPLYRNKMALSC